MNYLKISVSLIAKAINSIEEKLDYKRSTRNYRRKPYDIIWEKASLDSSSFIEERLANCMLFRSSEEMWRYTVSCLVSQNTENNYILEFGVAGGSSINYLSSRLMDYKFFGFDTFYGLPEEWKGHHAQKSGYSQKGFLPQVNKNVSLIKGLFSDSLPTFLAENPTLASKLALVHIDSDLYSSCEYVLSNLKDYLKPGCFVLFDEHHGYPNWRNGEFKSLNGQYVEGVDFDYVAFSNQQALIRLK